MRDNHFEQRGRSLHKFGRFESTVNSTTDAIDPGIDGLAVLSAARIAWPEKRLQDQRDGARIQRQHHHNERFFEHDEITVLQMVVCIFTERVFRVFTECSQDSGQGFDGKALGQGPW